MKLELKHLAAYLPYELQLQSNNGDLWILTSKNLDFSLVWWKPILRPMSDVDDDLFKEIGFADEEDFIQSVLDGDIFQKNFNKLLSLHFDVFGLIETGLAIDINTLKS